MTNPQGNQQILKQFQKQFLEDSLKNLNFQESQDKIKSEITKFIKIIFFGGDFKEGEIPSNVEIFNKEILEEKNINKFNLYKNFFIKSFLPNDNFFDQNNQLKENDILNLFKFFNEIFLSEALITNFSPIKNLEILQTLTKNGNQERINNLFQIIQSIKKEDFKNEIIDLIKNNNLNEERLNELIEKLNIKNKKINELNLFIDQINKKGHNEEVKKLLVHYVDKINKLNNPQKLDFFKQIIQISYLNDLSSIQFFKQSNQKKTLFPIFVKNLVFYIKKNNDQQKLNKVLEIFKIDKIDKIDEKYNIFQYLSDLNFKRFINLILNDKIDVQKFKDYKSNVDYYEEQVNFLNQFLQEDEKIIDVKDQTSKSGAKKEIFQLEKKEGFIDFFEQQSIKKNVKKISLYFILSIVTPIILINIEFYITFHHLINKAPWLFKIEKIQNPFLSQAIPICLYIFCCLALNFAFLYKFDKIIVNEIREIGEKKDLEDLQNIKSFWLELASSYKYNSVSNVIQIGEYQIEIDV